MDLIWVYGLGANKELYLGLGSIVSRTIGLPIYYG